MEESKNIFLYHLDHELQTLFGLNSYGRDDVFKTFMLITKLAILLCEGRIIVPISNYLESDLGFQIINELRPKSFMNNDVIDLASSSYNFAELVEKKQREHGEFFDEKDKHYIDIIKGDIILPGRMIKRDRSASIDIEAAWQSPEGVNKLTRAIYNKYPSIYGPGELEQAVADIPTKLGEMAYISRYITPLFEKIKSNKIGLDNEINSFITREYIKSFLDEYKAVCISDIPFFEAKNILPEGDNYQHISYRNWMERLSRIKYKRKPASLFLCDCSIDELYEFRYSYVWQSAIQQEEVKPNNNTFFLLKGANKVKNDNEKKDYSKLVDIGIITALPIEYAAAIKALGVTEMVYDKGNRRGNSFDVGKVECNDGSVHYVAVMMSGEGTNKAAIACTSMLNFFPRIDSIIMCGIAGGIPYDRDRDKGVFLGDVVVANSVIQYDYGKEEEGGFVMKAIPTKCNPKLIKAHERIEVESIKNKKYVYKMVKSLATDVYKRPKLDTDKIRKMSDKVEKGIRVEFDTVASGNKVVKKAALREEIRKKHSAGAIEMEGSGVADAAQDASIGFIIVRGICDYGDEDKNNIWHPYAAMSAAAYTYLLIQNYSSEQRVD